MPDSMRALTAFAATAAAFCLTGLAIPAGVKWWLAFPGFVVVTIGINYALYRPFELRREREANGQCVRCGYDLTGNVSGVCPECGSGR